MSIKRIHIAISTDDIAASVEDYSKRLAADPVYVVPGEYALWRTDLVNLSIRKCGTAGERLRHLGVEDSDAQAMSTSTDCNGILWEHFSSNDQDQEIVDVWPDAKKIL